MGVRVDNKMGERGYDFYISAFTGNGKYTYITFGTDVFSIRKNSLIILLTCWDMFSLNK